MSEPELAYMTGNDDFDLPRWQTQASLDSNTSHSPYYAPPPQPLTTHRNPQGHQSPATSTRQPRINQIVEEDNQFGVTPIQYSPNSLSRSASMNSASVNSRRRHDLEEAANVDSQRQFAGGSQHPNSLYPSSVPYPPQQPGNTAEAPYHDVYYNTSPSHPPKRSQTQHDPATSNRSGRSPLRHGPLSSQSTLDSYSSQQAQYSPTTTSGGYNYPDQQQSQRSYNQSAYQQTHNRVHSNPEHPDPPYPATSNPTSLSPSITNNPAHLAPRSVRQNSSSVPSSPLSFSHQSVGGMPEVPGSNHYYPQEPQPMLVEPTGKRKSTGFRRVRDASDLHPITSRPRTGRRMDGNGVYLSPIRQLTTHLVDTYHICNPQFRYESTHNPRRVLTKPSKPAHNDGYDNEDYDYILYVNDWLGTDDGHKYLILDILGQGTFGQVVKCQNMKTHEIVAVKVVKNKPAYFNQSMMEVTILELLNNQCDPNDEHHILRLRDSFIHRSHLCLVFELLSSNLYELIKQNQFQGLSTQLVKVFTAQLLDSLTVLKEARLIHCDLKPENILLKSLQSPQIKVIDFGSACHERQTVYTYIQSRFYRSPEVLLGIPYNASIDMWSLGCIAVELFLGLPLFPGTSEYNQITRIVEMLGMPSQYMMDMGKQTSHFFDLHTDAFGHKKYRLKALEQYCRERNANEQPGKQYFKATTLPDIINQAPMPNFKSSRHGTEVEKELNNRASFIDFCQGLLNLNPVERWTPQQARQHPFITGEKFTKPWSPHTQTPVPQPSPQHPITPTDPKRPYGGLVPSQPKGTRAFQDAASYNQHLAQHQAYTAQATAQANNFISRNPYITQPTGNGPPPFPGNQDKTGTGYNNPINSNTSTQQQYLGPNFPVPHNNPPPPPTSYYPSTNARTRAANANQMDNVPPALARLQHMNQDVIGGRNALTPVLKRDDAIREWERRQTGKVAAAQPYPQLEYLHQQAELVASQGLSNWHPGGNRYAGVGGSGQPPPTSGLAHVYHIPQTNSSLVVDEDRRDVVMSSVRNAARGDGQNTAFGASSDTVTSPSQVYTSNTTTGNRYPTYPQPSQQSQASSDISNLYVPMQPDQFVGHQGSLTQNQGANRIGGGGLGGGAPPLPTSFYPGGVNTSGSVQGGVKDARKQSNPDVWPR